MKFFASVLKGLLLVKKGVDFIRDFFRIFDWFSDVIKYAVDTYPYSSEDGTPKIKVEESATDTGLTKYTEIK